MLQYGYIGGGPHRHLRKADVYPGEQGGDHVERMFGVIAAFETFITSNETKSMLMSCIQ